MLNVPVMKKLIFVVAIGAALSFHSLSPRARNGEVQPEAKAATAKTVVRKSRQASSLTQGARAAAARAKAAKAKQAKAKTAKANAAHAKALQAKSAAAKKARSAALKNAQAAKARTQRKLALAKSAAAKAAAQSRSKQQTSKPAIAAAPKNKTVWTTGAKVAAALAARAKALSAAKVASAKAAAAKPGTSVAPVAPLVPPTAQAYVAIPSGVQTSFGQTMGPAQWLADALGASVGPVEMAPGQNLWRISYFGKTADFIPYDNNAQFSGQQVTLAAQPMLFDDVMYLPWNQLADFLGVKWQLLAKDSRDVMLLRYPAALIKNVRHSQTGDKVRIVVELSEPTRVVAAQENLDVRFFLAAARNPGVPTVLPVNDYLVPRAVTRSGNWQANVAVRLNYSAPVRWFTQGSPPRLVIDLQRLFEEANESALGGGLSLTKIRRGTGHGPVKMHLVRFDPREGWRLRVEPGGYSTLQRNRVSTIAKRAKSLVAINGGFFAYDGAAVGALLRENEWIRLPWKGRTALGITPDGSGHIGNLQTRSLAKFSSGLEIPVRDLNGWPDRNGVTAITRRFRSYVRLRAGDIAVVVKKGVVTSKPGGGGVTVPRDGFVLVAAGGSKPWLNRIARGETATLSIQPIGWPEISSALGGGPRLVNNGEIQMTALREDFRSDVRVGLGPRTAVGIDRLGRFLLLIVDGRQKFYSSGLTLTELAYTMRKLGAVNAMNFDGGGSTAIAVRGKVVNRPSDGRERAVSNALIVTR